MNGVWFRESGFVVLKVSEGFRFCEAESYRAISGGHLKEMDFGYFNGNKELRLVELSDLKRRLSDSERVKGELEEMRRKACDSIAILGSCWLSRGVGKDIVEELSGGCDALRLVPRKIKLVFVLRVDDKSTAGLVGQMEVKLRDSLGGLSRLYEIADVVCVTQYSIGALSDVIKMQS